MQSTDAVTLIDPCEVPEDAYDDFIRRREATRDFPQPNLVISIPSCT